MDGVQFASCWVGYTETPVQGIAATRTRRITRAIMPIRVAGPLTWMVVLFLVVIVSSECSEMGIGPPFFNVTTRLVCAPWR